MHILLTPILTVSNMSSKPWDNKESRWW